VPTPTPDPIVGPIVAASISATVQGGTATVTVPGALSVWIEADERVVVKAAGAIVFDGALPATGIITFPWTSETPLTMLTFTSRLTTGAPYSEQVVVTPAAGDKDPAATPADRRSGVTLASQSPIVAMPSETGATMPFGLTGVVLVTAAAAFVVAAVAGRRSPIEF